MSAMTQNYDRSSFRTRHPAIQLFFHSRHFDWAILSRPTLRHLSMTFMTQLTFSMSQIVSNWHICNLVAMVHLTLDTAALGPLPRAPPGMIESQHLAYSVRLRECIIPTASCQQPDLPHVRRLADRQIASFLRLPADNLTYLTSGFSPISTMSPAPCRTFLDRLVGVLALQVPHTSATCRQTQSLHPTSCRLPQLALMASCRLTLRRLADNCSSSPPARTLLSISVPPARPSQSQTTPRHYFSWTRSGAAFVMFKAIVQLTTRLIKH